MAFNESEICFVLLFKTVTANKCCDTVFKTFYDLLQTGHRSSAFKS